MTLDTIGAVIGYAQGLYLMGEEELRDIWLDGETLLRLSQLSGIPVARLVSGPITADEYADLTEWMETLTGGSSVSMSVEWRPTIMGEIIDLRAAAAEARAAYYSFVIELRERGICECAGGCERSATGADRIRLNELLRRWERLIPRDDLTF